jgi:hypothetical protein
MRLRIDFGKYGPKEEISWWQPLDAFPKLLRYGGKKWEWLMYGKDESGVYGRILIFVPLSTCDPNYYVDMPDFDEMLGVRGDDKCQCGAIHTSFPDAHMFFCPKWTKF